MRAFAAFLLLAFFNAQTVLAEHGYIEVHPLETMYQQLQEISMECEAHPLDRHCEERKQKLKEDIKRLRKMCKYSPEDERCQALYPPKKEIVSYLVTYCMDHPQDSRCVRRREQAHRREKSRLKYCSKHPDARRCQPPLEKPKGMAAMIEYCKVYPEKMTCKNFERRRKAARPREEAQSNTF